MKKFLIVALGCVSLLISGCSNSESFADKGSLINNDHLEAKLNILEKDRDQETPLSMMLYKLTVEWPQLYTQENIQKLLEAYGKLTWHVSEGDEQEKLINELEQHIEYQEMPYPLKKFVRLIP